MICIFCGEEMTHTGAEHTCTCGAYHWDEWQSGYVARLDRWEGREIEDAQPSLVEAYLNDTYPEWIVFIG